MRGYVRSLAESIIDVGSGFLLAIFIQLAFFPVFDLHPTIFESMQIAMIFTVISILRSWFWRSIFKKYFDDF